MNNKDNLPDGIIRPGDAGDSNEPKEKFEYSKKSNKKTLFLIILVLLVFFGIYYFTQNKNKIVSVLNKKEEEKIDIDVGSDIGNKYGEVAYSVYDNYEVDKFDLAFIDLNNSSDTEMIIKLNSNDKDLLIIYYIDSETNNIKNTRTFTNTDIELLYSLKDKVAEWYLHVTTTKPYGSYTRCSKILDGTAKSADIKTTNDTEIKAFEEAYVKSSYNVIYYEVKKESFLEDFKTMFDRISKYNEEINTEKENLINKYNDVNIDVEDIEDEIKIGEYTLLYGTYNYQVYDSEKEIEEAKEKGTYYINETYVDKHIILNRDSTITIDDTKMKYTYNGNLITLDDGREIRVVDNNIFVLNENGGIRYVIDSSYIKEESEENNSSN